MESRINFAKNLHTINRITLITMLFNNLNQPSPIIVSNPPQLEIVQQGKSVWQLSSPQDCSEWSPTNSGGIRT